MCSKRHDGGFQGYRSTGRVRTVICPGSSCTEAGHLKETMFNAILQVSDLCHNHMCRAGAVNGFRPAGDSMVDRGSNNR